MRIGNFPVVAKLVDAREALIARRDNGFLAIWIDGFKQDHAMLEFVRPYVKADLQRRIDEIEQQLFEFDVVVD